ncbi:hypothetical protein MJO28_007277 [Puccinia striiformis f. sp. tritici]|uniref:Uncharacterized protein n=1 Tax=Puccinia striiformis f. sp. tritici TaxID=168172 RepID=A0ACC0EFM3_9BASI|nr:hypothetical protein MJO28_007277 [Puccinia striiformis f. sp. tritici]KAI7955823.1 hypothetical protein MJO29_007222 [Puccinia striiformis f. sp. tritici]
MDSPSSQQQSGQSKSPAQLESGRATFDQRARSPDKNRIWNPWDSDLACFDCWGTFADHRPTHADNQNNQDRAQLEGCYDSRIHDSVESIKPADVYNRARFVPIAIDG